MILRNCLFKIYFKNFFLGSRALTIKAFLTPHGSRCATNVAIVRPLSPRGELQPVDFVSIFVKCRGVNSWGKLQPLEIYKLLKNSFNLIFRFGKSLIFFIFQKSKLKELTQYLWFFWWSFRRRKYALNARHNWRKGFLFSRHLHLNFFELID